MSVLSNGSIKHQFASHLAAAFLLSGAGIAVLGAQPARAIPMTNDVDFKSAELIPVDAATSLSTGSSTDLSTGSPVEAKSAVESAGTIASSSAPSAPNSADSSSLANRGSQPAAELTPARSSDILIHSHIVDGRQAATLYIKNIPVLTFIGADVNSLSNASDAVSLAAADSASLSLQASTARAGDILNSELENDPVLRATRLGNQLSSAEIDANALSVRWNEDNDGYVVTLAGADLVSLGGRTVLPDTTDNPAEDALQVTNRLRRLLGDVQPVSEIEGRPQPEPVAATETVAIVSSTVGGASWYGPGFNGRRSASGEVFNQNAMTAAHRTLPFGTRVRVTNLSNNRQVVVRINDRGPYSGSRVIDLSAGAAAEIGLINAGVGTVQLDILGE